MSTSDQTEDQRAPELLPLSLQTTLATLSSSLTDTTGRDATLRFARIVSPTTSQDVEALVVLVVASAAALPAAVAQPLALVEVSAVASAAVEALAADLVAHHTTVVSTAAQLLALHLLHQTHSLTTLLPAPREARLSMFAT